jgi:uncharacterized protein (TIGR02996 family)
VTDGEALIRSVLANPADDAPRLVYADWLEECGRAEDAEFIRVQVELARFGGAFHKDKSGRRRHMPAHVERLTERELELWFGGRGRPDLPEELVNSPLVIYPTPGQNLLLRRGFVERITCFGEIFVEVAVGLFRTQPVTHVTLVDRQPFESGDRFHWILRSGIGTYWNIGSVPPAVWPYMVPGGDTPSIAFATADEAVAALSWACVRYGRAAAGIDLASPPK